MKRSNLKQGIADHLQCTRNSLNYIVVCVFMWAPLIKPLFPSHLQFDIFLLGKWIEIRCIGASFNMNVWRYLLWVLEKLFLNAPKSLIMKDAPLPTLLTGIPPNLSKNQLHKVFFYGFCQREGNDEERASKCNEIEKKKCSHRGLAFSENIAFHEIRVPTLQNSSCGP